MRQSEFRSFVLESHGATPDIVLELLNYNRNVFDQGVEGDAHEFPLPNEPFVTAWRQYATEAESVGIFEVLRRCLVQLQFPIQAGISNSPQYRQATLRGVWTAEPTDAAALHFELPDQLRLVLHESVAGAIPVLLPASRHDFIMLVQALTLRNEPKPIPDSMGAAMVSGFVNWDRVGQLKRQWQQEHPEDRAGLAWRRHFSSNIVPRKELYQDRLIILSDGPYSGVSAVDLEIVAEEWQRLSLMIRLEHECTHYFTRRVLGSMRNNLLDELIADYRGIVHANGRFRADWCLWFLGLESFPEYRAGGRLENYRGDPPLSDEAMQVLCSLVVAAARNLEQYDSDHASALETPRQQAQLLIALTRLTLEELASTECDRRIEAALLPLNRD